MAIFKSVFATLVATLSLIAGAQQAPVILGQGYQGGNPIWGGQPFQNGGQFVGGGTQYTNEMLLQQLLGSRQSRAGFLNKCEVVGGVAGGTLGSLAEHHTGQAVVLGALLGGVIGNSVCEEQRRQDQAEAIQIIQLQKIVRVQQEQIARAQRGIQAGETTAVPAKCDFGDGVIAYTYEGKSGCDKIAAKMSSRVDSQVAAQNHQAQGSSEPVRAIVDAQNKAVNGVDLWKWRSGLASVNNPAPCVVEKITGENKPPFCSEMKVLARNDGETRSEWAIRAEKL